MFGYHSMDRIYMFAEFRIKLFLEIIFWKEENIKIPLSLIYVLSLESELIQANFSEWQLETCKGRGVEYS